MESSQRNLYNATFHAMDYYTAMKKQTVPCKNTNESYRCDAERKADTEEDRLYHPTDVKF